MAVAYPGGRCCHDTGQRVVETLRFLSSYLASDREPSALEIE
jgi:hypothetical protein